MSNKYNFIKIQKVIIRNFSLYKKKGKIFEVDEEINEGVYCLAGANGLGKTTFLSSINYGLTGIVLDPKSDMFSSPAEIIFENKRYTDRYFEGRISKKDVQNAQIEILFKVSDTYFRIVRGFFEREELRVLEIYKINGNNRTPLFKAKNESPKELNEHYQKVLAKEIGFINFDYFIFYQLYVLTFDETRRMIFWHERALQDALAVAFNEDVRDAERLSDLIRQMEKHESNGRNARYQAKQALDRADDLRATLKGKPKVNQKELENAFNRLNKEVAAIEKDYANIKIEFDTHLKKQSYLNAEIVQMKAEHTKLFSRYSKPRSKLLENANIKLTLKKMECCLCGSHGSGIVVNVERNIYKDNCPLCNTAINEKDNSEQSELLQVIRKNDQRLAKKTEELNELIGEVEGKMNQLEKVEMELNSARDKLKDFNEDNPDFSANNKNKDNNSLIEQYQNQFKFYDEESKREYKLRDKLKPEYDRLLRKIEAAYKEAETVFVPIFKKLAESFIGRPLNIAVNRGERNIKLVLEVEGSARTVASNLSESQRFFLDIALRMSLAIFLSKKGNGATMMIDTPEGSLDIAYESRVGDMFAQFVCTFHQNMIMAANINASQLLVSLAEKCGKKKMEFKRMLDWTDLSQVQKDGEHLFQEVYSRIELALDKKK